MIDKKKIAILGGTGNLGYGLAWRWARAGHEVVIGSRVAEKAHKAAAELNRKPGGEGITGADNLSCDKTGGGRCPDSSLSPLMKRPWRASNRACPGRS